MAETDIREPRERYWTAASIEILSARFEIPEWAGSQDWPYEVADPEKLDDYVSALSEFGDDPDVIFTLMDMILESLEDLERESAPTPHWSTVTAHLIENVNLHEYQIWYWSSWGADLSNAWAIAPKMREIWNASQNAK